MPRNNSSRKFILNTLFLFFAFVLIGGVFPPSAYLQSSSGRRPAPRPSPTVVTAEGAARMATPAPTPTPRRAPRPDGPVVVSGEGIGYETKAIESPPSNTTIRGRVFYSDTGRPVKRASVMLMPEDAVGGPGELAALTDSQGNFQIKKVRAGTYYPFINAPGIVSPLAFANFSKIGGGAEKEMFAEAFKHFEKIIANGINDVDVQVPAIRGGAIGGRVIYDDGDPAIGIKVEVLRKIDGKYSSVIPNFSSIMSMFTGMSGSFSTDDRGVFRFAGLPSGEYILRATESASHGENSERNGRGFESVMFGAGGGSLLSVYYPDAFETNLARVINVELGQELSEVNIMLPSRNLFRVAGKVVRASDKSPVKAGIKIKRKGAEEIGSIFEQMMRREMNGGSSGEEGEWAFKDLPKGTYTLTLEDNETGPEYYDEEPYAPAANRAVNAVSNVSRPPKPPKPRLAKKTIEITIEDKDLADIVIEMGYGATVMGNISVENNKPMPESLTIVATGNDTSTSKSLYNGNNGNRTRQEAREFSINGVSEGKTKFSFIPTEGYYVKSARSGSTNLLSDRIELKEGQVLRDIQVVLSSETGLLKGKVFNKENNPAEGAKLLVVPSEKLQRKNQILFQDIVTDQKGEFEKKLAPMEYFVIDISSMPAPKTEEEYEAWIEEAIKNAQKITIEVGRIETITIKLQ